MCWRSGTLNRRWYRCCTELSFGEARLSRRLIRPRLLMRHIFPPTGSAAVFFFYNVRENISGAAVCVGPLCHQGLVGGGKSSLWTAATCETAFRCDCCIGWSPSQLCTQSFSLSNLLTWDCPPAVCAGHPLVAPLRFTRRREQLLHLLLLFAIKIQ